LLYYLLYPLHTTYPVFNVFRYITFRAALAGLVALLVSFLIGPYLIRYLTAMQIGQPIREDGPSTHAAKAGTPTMGGDADHPFPFLIYRPPCRYWKPVHYAYPLCDTGIRCDRLL